VAGRVLRSAVLAGQGPGTRLWTWDGRDDAGRRVAAGAYRARAYSRSGGTSRSLVVLR
jgi:flagellar hook assembly protein FlgD